jgi:UDP-glucuronate 4-epimerase
MSKTVLVTGGAGFIGSHLVERLAQRGDRVLVVDNFDAYYPRAIKEENLRGATMAGRVAFAEVDVRDYTRLRALFQKAKADAVVHLAARPGVRPSFETPHVYLDINVRGTLNVLMASREFGVSKMLFASSSSVYGSVPAPADEELTPCRPLSPYGASKVAGEALCSAAAGDDLSVTALRFFTVYGPRQRPDMAIAKFSAAIAGGTPITLYGDGDSSRDYTYISDTVTGIVSALDTELSGYNVINLGRGKPLCLRDLVRLIELGLDVPATLRFEPDQPGDPLSTCADISRARAFLGYRPSVTPQEGVIRYTAWLQESQREFAGSSR